MPVYDYKCISCGHRFDLLRSVSSRDDVKCPSCGGDVARVYEGRWASLGKRPGGGGCSCGGNCRGCSGCGG
ncbi:MAG: zinc ribbon domain-containing protein [Clostridia bacterium]|nr:zinc ribbon domain-containing protein [Clostridia bacterium]